MANDKAISEPVLNLFVLQTGAAKGWIDLRV